MYRTFDTRRRLQHVFEEAHADSANVRAHNFLGIINLHNF